VRVPRDVYRNLLADSAWADRLIFDNGGRVFLDGARPCWRHPGYLPVLGDYCDGTYIQNEMAKMGGLVQVVASDDWFFALPRPEPK
jgi:hypothetical protein